MAVSQSARYFRHADYNRAHDFTFAFEIEGADTIRIRHYKVEFDQFDRPVLWEYRSALFSANDPTFGLHKVTIRYDSLNRYYKYFDVMGRPMRALESGIYGSGQFGEHFTYDYQRGTVLQQLYNRLGGYLQYNGDGCNAYHWDVDKTGYKIHSFCLDAYGLRVADVDSIYESRYTNDSLGRLIEIKTFDNKGKLIVRALITNDSLGRRTSEKYLDHKNRPYPDVPSHRYVYDSNGYQIEDKSFGGKGKLLSSERKSYDYYGNLLQIQKLDENGRVEEEYKFIYNDLNMRVASIVKISQTEVLRDSTVFDRKGRLVEQWLMGHSPTWHDSVVRTVTFQYDSNGNISVEKYLNARGQIIAGPNGVAIIEHEYNEWGDLIKTTHRHPDGRLAKSNDKSASTIVYRYLPAGGLTNIVYYDPSGSQIFYYDPEE